MNYSESKSFFEVSNGLQLDNTFRDRLLCVKDFLKKSLFLPLALVLKVCKTLFKGIGVGFGVVFVLMTVGFSPAAREFFFDRVISLAKDLADWILLPFAIIGRLLRLILALLIHPQFYFNAIF